MSNLGFNTGYIEELFAQFQEDPSSVNEIWQEFFTDFQPSESFVPRRGTAIDDSALPPRSPQAQTAPASGIGPGKEVEITTETGKESEPAPTSIAEAPDAQTPAGDKPTPDSEKKKPAASSGEEKPIRGAGARIVDNMEASLGVPTATSVRDVPVKLMAENRRLLNAHQKHIGGEKISYTHIIAFAVAKTLAAFPNLNSFFRRDDDEKVHVSPASINLGLAIDVEKRGKRTLMVPNIKAVDQMNFATLLGAYNDLVRRAREGLLEVSDLTHTTVTITNPGMIGTDLSVPRLMPGQGVIIGIGSISYPTEYYAIPPEMMGRSGISQVMTLTSTYDHRIIQGAESGAFLGRLGEYLQGEHGFYEEIFKTLHIPFQPFKLTADTTPRVGISDGRSEIDMIRKQARVLQLIRAYRVRGHLQADINPLGYEWVYHGELDPATYGLTIWDLDREFVTGGLGGCDILSLREILDILRISYTRKIGVEFMHISDPEERKWIQERIEPNGAERDLNDDEKGRMLEKLNAAEAFETFLHTKYIGHKRFSLEGSETIIPLLDRILSDAAEIGVSEVVIGMAHRGRLNVLANIVNKPYDVIFSEFEGNLDPNTTQGSGDVKYHLGATGVHVAPSGAQLKVVLASNPSHLEAVNPVVEGMVRAKQETLQDTSSAADEQPSGKTLDAAIPLLVHGDASFAGQGVIAETLHLSKLPGYRTGGTIHLVINNQIGFTTGPDDARSSTYATDIARMIQAPIFHVNGDDPEACVRVGRMALAYRQEFNMDVVIDLLCFRVRGHNEADEPMFTQPVLYKKIEGKRSVRKIYTELLLRRGDMTIEDAEQILKDYRFRLDEAFESTREIKERTAPIIAELAVEPRPEYQLPTIKTSSSSEELESVLTALVEFPADLHVHKKLKRQFDKRTKIFLDENRVDWALAEMMAFGTLMQSGIRVRLSGQDSRRGTFSHRHAVIYDQDTNAEYIPLNHITDTQNKLFVYDSLLSEYAVCGFEYGYSVSKPEALVIWEAQFGDFANGAQIIFDQFLSSASEKWDQQSSLVLLLPHGFEGQGPEHSSARLERFLQMAAEGNMSVCTFTTPANYFHALRRQASPQVTIPLVVMSPKSLLRHASMMSPVDDFTKGGFKLIIPDTTDPGPVRRLILCSGKVYFDFLDHLSSDNTPSDSVSVCRIEQFYPFPESELQTELARFSNLESVVWLQEEPENMGAWSFLRHRIDDLIESLGLPFRVRYAGRVASASTATGSAIVHQAEQRAILASAVTI